MKLILQAFLYCCLVATAAHCMELEVKPKLKKRLSIWLGSRLRRDLDSKTENSEHFVRQDDIRDTMLPHSSTETHVRTKRSKNSANQSRRQGCYLGTCSVHDLAHRLHLLNNTLKIGSAPCQDQPTRIRPQTSLPTRPQSRTETGAGQAQACVEHH